jgi:hypothetical protein
MGDRHQTQHVHYAQTRPISTDLFAKAIDSSFGTVVPASVQEKK